MMVIITAVFFRFDHGHVRKRYAFCAFACEAVWSVAVARTCQKFLSVLRFFAFGGGPDADCFGQIIAVEETASQIVCRCAATRAHIQYNSK